MGVPQKDAKLTDTTYTEDLVQTLVGPMLATSFFVSPCDPCLVESVGRVLLVSSTHSDSHNISALSSVGFLKLWGKDLRETSNLD